MYSDEQTSWRRFFPRRRSWFVDLEELHVPSQEEDDAPHETNEPKSGDGGGSPPFKSRPLTLFDDYKIVGGVPTFVFSPEDDPRVLYRPFGLSSDGSLMALATASTTICVYNLLDGCSLVARKEDISTDRVLFVSFWKDSNDELVVFSLNRMLSFFSVSEKLSPSDEDAASQSDRFKELSRNRSHQLEYEFDGTVDWLLDCFTHKSTMWIADLGMIQSMFIHVTRIAEGELQYAKLYDHRLGPVIDLRIRVGVDVVNTEGWTNTMPQQKVSFLYDKIDFRENEVQAKPSDLQRSCIGLSVFGKHRLLWQSDAGGQNWLNFYSNGLSQISVERPDARLKLGEGVIGVEAIPLHRATWASDDNDGFVSRGWPLICVFRIKLSRADVLVWDPDVDRTLTKIEVIIKEVEFTSTSKIKLSSSYDGKWLAIVDCSAGVIALISLFSGVQVWKTKLHMSPIGADRFMLMTFDVLNTKLVVNGGSEVYVFNLPCLVKGYDISFKGIDRVTAFTSGPNLAKEMVSVIRNEQLGAQHNSAFLCLSLLDLFFRKAADENAFDASIRVAHPFFAPKMAVMIHNATCFSIIFASLEEISSSKFIDLVSKLAKGRTEKHEFNEIKIKEQIARNFKSPLEIECIVLHPNETKTNDSIAIFGSNTELCSAIFIDRETNSQRLIRLGREMVHVFVQSKDGSRVIGLKENGIVVIDLEKRQIAHEVPYAVNLLHWIYTFHPERHFSRNARFLIGTSSRKKDLLNRHLTQAQLLAPPQIAKDGSIILLRWSVKDQRPIYITPTTNYQDLEEAAGQDKNVMPCWSLDDTFRKFSFLEFEEDWRSITSVGTYDYLAMKLSKDKWGLQMQRYFERIDRSLKWTYHMALQENDGSIKITVILKAFSGYEVTILPVTPYSRSLCLPCLHGLDYRSDFRDDRGLQKFSKKFGASFFNMQFNGKTNLHIAVEHKDANMVRSLVSNACRDSVLLGIKHHQSPSNEPTINLLDVAIQQNSEDVVRSLLDVFRKHQVPLVDGAAVIRESFEPLWKSNQVVLEELLSDNSLCLKMFTSNVPSRILKNKTYTVERVGTCEDLLITRKESKEVHEKICKSSSKQLFKKINKRVGDTEVRAIVKVFCFENLCKVGSKGILRFLLSQQAPAYLFKAPLVKWTILYKWEHIWRRKSVYALVRFGVMLIIFSSYIICIGFYGHRLINDLACRVCITFLLIGIMLFVMVMFCEELTQLKTYIKDGRELFPESILWGIKHYLGSFWNVIDTCICLVFLFLILPFHFVNFNYIWHFPMFYVGLAIESSFMWFKVWYFAQAFSETGAFVLLIESVARDCVPFVVLSASVLIGFSLGLFAMFQDIVKAIDTTDHEDTPAYDASETQRRIVHSFKNPLEAMLTLFCAMIGAFDVEVYLESGGLSPFIIVLFILYLSIQAIVMFNMLIGKKERHI